MRAGVSMRPSRSGLSPVQRMIVRNAASTSERAGSALTLGCGQCRLSSASRLLCVDMDGSCHAGMDLAVVGKRAGARERQVSRVAGGNGDIPRAAFVRRRVIDEVA